MFATFRTLILGANARAEDRVRDAFAIELIDQKIREAESTLAAAKTTLASLIQRKRAEERMLAGLDTRIGDLTLRATEALRDGREDLAERAAGTIAELENEREVRRATLERLEVRVQQLRTTVEAAHRRIVDLKQGAIAARAIRREQAIQGRLTRTLAGPAAADEAEALIRRVTEADDPFEQGQILRDIDRGLSGEGIAETLSDEGYGPATRATRAAVLARLRATL